MAERKTGSRRRDGGAAVEPIDDGRFAETVGGSALPVLVDFHVPWCGPCREASQALPALAERFAGRLRVVGVEAEANPEAAELARVECYPTFVLFHLGAPVDRLEGWGGAAETADWIRRALGRIEGTRVGRGSSRRLR